MAFRTNKMPVLQEKSASGAVATFSTALAMPLASCNIAVNAWQEGSGDPSPSNVRAIHGFDKQNIYQRGVNLFDVSAVEREKWVNIDTGAIENGSFAYYLTDYIPVKAGVNYTMNSTASSRRWTYDINKQPVSVISSDTFTPSVDGFVLVTIHESRLNFFYMTIGSTIQPKEPYTGNTYTIQLGQEVYGAEVDAVNGVAHVNKGYHLFDGSEDEEWRNYSSYNGFQITVSGMVTTVGLVAGLMSNWLRARSGAGSDITAYRIANGILYTLGITNNISEITDLASWRTYLNDNPLQFVYPLKTPFDIQLTPTQIETLIGNNTIFADTGDIDLTFKDLDIAKRGNFREVFRLPS